MSLSSSLPLNFRPMRSFLVLLVAVLAAALGAINQPGPASAATIVVRVGQNSSGSVARSFNPAVITIQAGDTVRWDWFAGSGAEAHDVQSYTTGLFSSGGGGGINASNPSYQYTFSLAGAYTYYCSVHAGRNDADPATFDTRLAGGKMIGKVVVNPPAGGSRTLIAQPVSFPATTLSGFDQDVNATQQTWRASDTTGTGGGWNVTITGANFTTAAGSIPAAQLKVRVLQTNVTVVSGNAAPVTQAPNYTPFAAGAALKVLIAAVGAGAGTYDFKPDFRLTIPASALEGNYSASLVVSINSGP